MSEHRDITELHIFQLWAPRFGQTYFFLPEDAFICSEFYWERQWHAYSIPPPRWKSEGTSMQQRRTAHAWWNKASEVQCQSRGGFVRRDRSRFACSARVPWASVTTTVPRLDLIIRGTVGESTHCHRIRLSSWRLVFGCFYYYIHYY